MDLFGNPEGLFLVLQIYAPLLKCEGTEKSSYNPQLQSTVDQKLLILLSPEPQGRSESFPCHPVWVTVATDRTARALQQEAQQKAGAGSLETAHPQGMLFFPTGCRAFEDVRKPINNAWFLHIRKSRSVLPW